MNIGLLGFGVVGGGVWELAQENRALNVKKVLVRREAPSLGETAVQDVEAILRDPDIDTVVEVLGGLHPAYEWICRALAGGKNVVTANKAVISAYYRELTALACENRVALRCTAAVGGGIPWLVNLQRCRRVDTVTEVGGIMNGTTNFIMDAMARQGADFPAVLQRAQELGYAEADPSADIDGDDIRRKLTISANIAFDALLREEDIPAFGHPHRHRGGCGGLPGSWLHLQAAGLRPADGDGRGRLCGACAGGGGRAGGGGAGEL